MRIALLASSGYLTAERGGELEPKRGLVTANRPQSGAWEQWTVEKQDDGSVALKSVNGCYLCAEGGGGSYVYANRSQVGAWEKFRPSGPLDNGRILTISTSDGLHALSVSAQGEHVVDAAGARTAFTVEVIDAEQATPSPDSPLTPLRRDGIDIYAGDTRYVHRQATNYLLFQRFMEGHDLSRLWYDGFEGYNVSFLMKTVPEQAGLPALTPDNYPKMYQRADDFLGAATAKGKRIEGTLVCDNNQLGYSRDKLGHHVDQLCEVFRAHPGHMVQLANEWEKNGIDVMQFSKPDGVFASRGSSLAGGPCPLPAWDYSTAHLSRDGGGAYLDAQSYYMVEGYDGYAGTHGPVIVNETRGASNTENSGRRTTDAAYFRKIASAMKGWSGGTFHPEFGIHSEPCEEGTPQDNSRKAFVEGIA